MATLFPSLKPNISNELWFSVDNNTIVESDGQLTKQEIEHSLAVKEEINKGNDIIPIGKIKEKNEDLPEEDDDLVDDDDESNEELEDDTDEFDTASNEVDSIEEHEMV